MFDLFQHLVESIMIENLHDKTLSLDTLSILSINIVFLF
jgi:hypothetical protein